MYLHLLFVSHCHIASCLYANQIQASDKKNFKKSARPKYNNFFFSLMSYFLCKWPFWLSESSYQSQKHCHISLLISKQKQKLHELWILHLIIHQSLQRLNRFVTHHSSGHLLSIMVHVRKQQWRLIGFKGLRVVGAYYTIVVLWLSSRSLHCTINSFSNRTFMFHFKCNSLITY